MDLEIINQHGLTEEEYRRIVNLIGREPNWVELGIFSVMWSEHCCYKSSKIYLKQFPTKGPRVLQGPGENAGIIDIGGEWAVAFKIESHNHPSFIEPYQGAATGVGGILRDIFTMGARPIANLNSLRFGDLSHPKTPYLVRGVVAGIGGYGNCVGIPTIGGEAFFDPCYNGNILVNAFTLGILKKDKIFRGIASGVGNPVILVGSKTGRDGIHGATMASDVFDAESESKRPTVQVGDPFTEKKLLEACLEAFQLEGAIVGIQDMGAAGFTCSSFEMSERGDSGMELFLDQIPQREEGMNPYEIMLSESQERMLLVAKKGREEELKTIFEKWELEFAIVGQVIAEKKVRGLFHDEVIFDLPVVPVTKEAPVYERPVQAPVENVDPARLSPPFSIALFNDIPINNLTQALEERMISSNICSKKWIWEQYDSTVGTNTLLGPGGDAAVIRLKETDQVLALTVEGKNRWCALDPYWGAVHTVTEAARNLACVGAEPIGLTDGLNFGNPENPEVMWQFKEVCRGISNACLSFEIPVVGGNVSLYNETEGLNIQPTPIVAMVGLLKNPKNLVSSTWKQEKDLIFLLGELAKSFAVTPLDFEKEKIKQRFCIDAIAKGLIQSAHDVSEGGLAVTLAESCFLPDGEILGAEISISDIINKDAFLFAEAPAPIVVSVKSGNRNGFIETAKSWNCPILELGVTGGNRLQINTWIDIGLMALRKRWEGVLCAAL